MVCSARPDRPSRSAFGTNGFVVPATANVPAERHFADAAIVGEMSGGRILIHCADFGIARLHPDGSLDTSYAAATGNFIAPKGFDYIAFPDSMKHQGATLASTWMQLEPDGSIIVALGSRRVSGNPNLEIGLRRIDPTGAPDPAFGLGEGGLLSVPNAARAKLYTPRGTTSPDELFTRADPVGIEWLGGMLYLAVSAVAGAGLGVDVLVIMRSHPDGTTDYGFNTDRSGRAAQKAASPTAPATDRVACSPPATIERTSSGPAGGSSAENGQRAWSIARSRRCFVCRIPPASTRRSVATAPTDSRCPSSRHLWWPPASCAHGGRASRSAS